MHTLFDASLSAHIGEDRVEDGGDHGMPAVGEPIIIAGITIAPGDLAVADRDGVMAPPQSRVSQTVENARKRTEKEAATTKRLMAGETTLDILGLTAHRKKAG